MSVLDHFVKLKPTAKSEILITDKRLGDILIEQNIINLNQLKHALHYQKTHPDFDGKIGEICVQLGWVKKIDLIKVVSQHYHIPLATAILEKREIARNMRKELEIKKMKDQIIGDSFFDSLGQESLNKDAKNEDALHSESMTFEDTMCDGSAKPRREEQTLVTEQSTTKHTHLNENTTTQTKPKKPNQHHQTILDLVLTKRLQNGLIKTNDQKEKKSVDYILALIKTSELDDALMYLNKIKHKYMHSALFCQVEVFALMHNFEFDLAETCLNDFDADYELYPQLLDLKSIIHQILNQHEQAIINYRSIIQTKKLTDFCFFSLAYSLEQLNLSKQANIIYKHFTTLADITQNKQLSYAQSKI